jgi:hypothetical protein
VLGGILFYFRDHSLRALLWVTALEAEDGLHAIEGGRDPELVLERVCDVYQGLLQVDGTGGEEVDDTAQSPPRRISPTQLANEPEHR